MNESNNPTRRDVLKSLAGAIAAATLARARGLGLAPAPSGVKVRAPSISAAGTSNAHFFSAEQKEMVATVADLIIPSDEVSPGARAAGVHDWIDFVVANSPTEIQQQWRAGLVALDRASEEARGKQFLALDSGSQRQLLEPWAEREDSPSSTTERFFVLAKEATVNGYYTSEIGLMQDLKYQGATYVDEPEVACPAQGSSASAPRGRKGEIGHAHSSQKGD